MMDFAVKQSKNGARLGRLIVQLKDSEVTVQTPACMLYTKGASAPHLDKDVLKRLKNVPSILHVPITHM